MPNDYIINTHFGTDGIRGDARQFTYGYLAAVLDGLAAYHGSTDFSLLLGGDTRISTERILADLSAIAAARGIACTNIGVFPTPGINFYLEHLGLDYAIDVTASHNPVASNGLKVFEYKNGKSEKVPAAARTAIEAALAQADLSVTSGTQTSLDTDNSEAITAYESYIRDYVRPADFSGLRIALDCADGATSVLGGRLFEELGAAEVALIHSDASFAENINNGCGSTHLEPLIDLVKTGHYNLGAAFDGDGDRCMLVDHQGREVNGDKILAILAAYLHLDSLVATEVAGQGLLNWADDHGLKVHISNVGDQNVYNLMQETGTQLGGEQNGHIILPHQPMGNGLLTALMMTKAVADQHTTLAALSDAVPATPQASVNVPANALEKQNLPQAEPLIAEYRQLLAAQRGRLHVRPSGTEDLIRINLWGDDQSALDTLAAEFATKLQEIIK